jgi:hypothetical protein
MRHANSKKCSISFFLVNINKIITNPLHEKSEVLKVEYDLNFRYIVKSVITFLNLPNIIYMNTTNTN